MNNLILLFSTLSIVFVYYIVAFLTSVNFPLLDDYNYLLDLLRIQDHQSLTRKFYSIIAQHNEHRITFARIVGILQIKIFGEINFRILAAIGNLGILIAALFFAAGNSKSRLELFYYFCLSAVILCNPFQGYTMGWAMASLSNIWSFSFSIISLYILSLEKNLRFPFACAFSGLAAFSGGHGLVFLPVGFLFLLLSRKLYLASLWLIWCFFLWILYFKIHFIYVVNPINDSLVKITHWFLLLLSAAPSEAFISFFSFIKFQTAEEWKKYRLIFGLFLLPLFGTFFWSSLKKQKFFYSASLIYCFSLFILTAYKRAFIDFSYCFSTQYRNLSLFAFLLLFVGIIELYPIKKTHLKNKMLYLAFFINIIFWVREFEFIQRFFEYRLRSKESFVTTGNLYAAPSRKSDLEYVKKLQAMGKPSHIFLENTEPKGDDEIILWKSYLYGIMDLNEIHWSKGIIWSKQKLSSICHLVDKKEKKDIFEKTKEFLPLLTIQNINGKYLLRPFNLETYLSSYGIIWRRSSADLKVKGDWKVVFSPQRLLIDKSLAPDDRIIAEIQAEKN